MFFPYGLPSAKIQFKFEFVDEKSSNEWYSVIKTNTRLLSTKSQLFHVILYNKKKIYILPKQLKCFHLII